MSHNLYWAIYQNLEEGLIELSNNIHIDDEQLNVYSMKIAEMLIRISVEVESIAKELYFKMVEISQMIINYFLIPTV